jgi:hypothetical protein
MVSGSSPEFYRPSVVLGSLACAARVHELAGTIKVRPHRRDREAAEPASVRVMVLRVAVCRTLESDGLEGVSSDHCLA